LKAVAVTGHRAAGLADAEPALLRRRVAEVLAAAAGDAGAGARPRLWSSLAEGSDRIAAEAALGLGWELACALPMPRRQYEDDFSEPASLEEFRRLLAHATVVAELPPAAPGDRPAAYAEAGRRLLAEADLLLAIWDGEPARGVGGTAEVVAAAADRAIPIAWIDARSPHAVALWSPGGTAWRPLAPAELRAELARSGPP
jgi:hypothetical protein